MNVDLPEGNYLLTIVRGGYRVWSEAEAQRCADQLEVPDPDAIFMALNVEADKEKDRAILDTFSER